MSTQRIAVLFSVFLLLIVVAVFVLKGQEVVAPVNVDEVTTPVDEVRDTKNILDLSNQSLIAMPDYVLEATQLEVLNLSRNNISETLPAEIRFLTNLRVLDISHNSFTNVPAEVGQLTELTELNLSYNKLTGLPHEIGNLQKLQVLDVRGNEYSETDMEVIRAALPSSTNIITD